jgi:hypothetical protein
VGSIARLAIDVRCPGCDRENTLLVPEGCCGNEFVWHVRCGGCGAWRWFHSREDTSFVMSVKETARRRDEPGGLSAEGTREAHAVFEKTVDPCACGGAFRVVFEMKEVPCLGCGRSLRDAALPVDRGRTVEVPPLRASR